MNDEMPQDRVRNDRSRDQAWILAAIASLVLGVGAGALVWMARGSQYRAEAWLLIQDRRPYIAFPGESNSQMFARTQIELVRSPVVLIETLSNSKIAQLPEIKSQEAPLEWLSDHLKVSAINGSEIYQVTFEGPDPEGSAEIVDAVLASYMSFQSQQAVQQHDNLIRLLNEQKTNRVDELGRLHAIVREKTKRATGEDPGFVSSVIVQPTQESPVHALQKELALYAIERQVYEGQLSAKKEQYASMPTSVSGAQIEQAIAVVSQVKKLRDKLAAQHVQLRALEQSMSSVEKKSAAVELKVDVAALEKSLADFEGELRTKYADDFKQAIVAEREKELTALQDKVEEQKLLESIYSVRLANARKDQERLAEHSLDLELAHSEMAHAEQVLGKIQARLTALRTEQAAPTQVSQLARATVPVDPVNQSIGPIALAALCGFLLPLFVAGIWNSQRERDEQRRANDNAETVRSAWHSPDSAPG